MKFGVREICDVVFKAKADTKIGSTTFKKVNQYYTLIQLKLLH